MQTSELIQALCQPSPYPHSVDLITTIETHISVVFLTGEFAYKLKKPVDFGFLDFSSLSNRKRFCDLEVSLNRRYAPELYLGVVPLFQHDDKKISLTPQTTLQKPIDYLVKMKQFDPNQVLGRKLREEELSEQQLNALAEQIATFHQNAESVAISSMLGEPETILQPMLDNFPTLFDHIDSVCQMEVTNLKSWTDQTYSELLPLIKQRKAQGFIKACHGDLHVDNITLINNRPMLFDGIEFNESFRWIDVISDLAFLLIDLDFKSQHPLQQSILSLYLSLTTDYNGLKLLRFYQVYRALVRAKITMLRASQLDNKSIEAEHLHSIAFEYIALATNYTKTDQNQKLILLQGVSGCGKSFFSQQLITHQDAIIISSDRVRKQLYGIHSLARVNDTEKGELYSQEMNNKVYEAMLDYAVSALQAGYNVIVDATFLRHEHRNRFYQKAAELNRKTNTTIDSYLIFLDINADFARFAIKQRLHQNNNPSDAGIAVMERQLQLIEPPRPEENALTLHAARLRHHFPLQKLQEFLNLPLQTM